MYYFTYEICKMPMILDLPIRNASCNSTTVILEDYLMLKKIISENVVTQTHIKMPWKKRYKTVCG